MQSCTELRSPLLNKKSGGSGGACMTGIGEHSGPLQTPVRMSLCTSEALGCLGGQLAGATASCHPHSGAHMLQGRCWGAAAPF